MKKIFTYMLAGLSLLLFSRCDALDIDPTSSIADSNYWKTEAQFSTFNVGLHALLRECSFNFFLLGEPRADIYGDVPFGGEATQGMERLPFNTINKENTGISNFAGMYKVINQINLMIAKTKETTVLSEAGKNYYLGEAYGMRAYLYFHLLRSWGDVILYLDYTNGASLDLSNLSKAASPAEEVMKQIKEDITASEKGFGSDYSFKYGRYYWSMAATQMLKGEVYLWTANNLMERIPIDDRNSLIVRPCGRTMPSGINLSFERLSPSHRQVGYVLLTRAPVAIKLSKLSSCCPSTCMC